MEKEITIDNAAQVLADKMSDSPDPAKAAAWEVVYNYCKQLGMQPWHDEKAVEAVVRFIYQLKNK